VGQGSAKFLRSGHAAHKEEEEDGRIGFTFNSKQQKYSNIIVVLFVSFLLNTQLRITPEIFEKF
jgi:hypothetical protein